MNSATARSLRIFTFGALRQAAKVTAVVAIAWITPHQVFASGPRQDQTPRRSPAPVLHTEPHADAWLSRQLGQELPSVEPSPAYAAVVDAWGFLGTGTSIDENTAAQSPVNPDGPTAIPRLQGSAALDMAQDGSVTLRFDQPVGSVRVHGGIPFSIRADDSRRVFRLEAGSYEQGHAYPLRLSWQAVTGAPLPPLSLQVTTPPALSVSFNTEGIGNLGLVYPLHLTFSEPLQDRTRAKQALSVKTADGQDVSGTWLWVGRQRLQFTPKPAWPASSIIEVRGDGTVLRTQRGGRLEAPLFSSFGTGTDRRIFVYLDKQQATAVENGQVVRTFKVSTGKPKTPTSAGDFYIYDRYLRKTMRSRGIPRGHPGYYEVEDVPYTQFFKGDLALHGAFWHNGFGRPASHGCVNLSTREKNKRWPHAVEDAGWLYNWASLGVPVTVYKDTPVEMAVK